VCLRLARWPEWSMPSSDTNAHSDAYGLTRKPAKLLANRHNIDMHPRELLCAGDRERPGIAF